MGMTPQELISHVVSLLIVKVRNPSLRSGHFVQGIVNLAKRTPIDTSHSLPTHEDPESNAKNRQL